MHQLNARSGIEIPLVITLCCMGLVGFITNGIFVYVISKNRILHTPTHMLLGSLGFVNCIMIALRIQWAVCRYLMLYLSVMERMLCVVITIELQFSDMFDIFHLAAIAIERYIYIFYPLRHCAWVTEKRMYKVIALCWILPIACFVLTGGLFDHFVVSIVPVVNSTQIACKLDPNRFCLFLFTNFGLFSFIFLMLCTIYLRILLEAKKQRRMIDKIRKSVTLPGEAPVVVRKRSDIKLIALIFLDSLVYGISYVIIATMSMVLGCISTANLEAPVRVSMIALSSLNPVISPIILGLGNRDIRQKFFKLIGIKSGKGFDNQTTMSAVSTNNANKN